MKSYSIVLFAVVTLSAFCQTGCTSDPYTHFEDSAEEQIQRLKQVNDSLNNAIVVRDTSVICQMLKNSHDAGVSIRNVSRDAVRDQLQHEYGFAELRLAGLGYNLHGDTAETVNTIWIHLTGESPSGHVDTSATLSTYNYWVLQRDKWYLLRWEMRELDRYSSFRQHAAGQSVR
jgi:hypothetical protein